MLILELLRSNHGHEEIDEQQRRDDADDDCFHAVLLQLLAETDVQRANEKKRHDDSDKD